MANDGSKSKKKRVKAQKLEIKNGFISSIRMSEKKISV